MKRKTLKPYLYLLIAILICLSLSATTTQKIRGAFVAFLSPLWEQIAIHNSKGKNSEIQRLQLENKQLKNEITKLQKIYEHETVIVKQLYQFPDPTLSPLTEQHLKELHRQLSIQLTAIPGRVIFRSPAAWSSCLWLNVGSADNEKLNRNVIAKNSPVVLGNALVGVVDYVGKHQCRVRLITDSGLTPAVRAVRKRGDQSWHLAKGILHGSSEPLWRSLRSKLRGTGFNYDFADEHGPARELKSGAPFNTLKSNETVPLLKINDSLVTTGLDGVFPAGLYVGKVSKINPLQEGDYYYELEADPVAGNMDDLSLVYVIPPIGYDANDQAPVWGD